MDDRAARVAEIHDTAITHTALGVRALHDRLPDGRHRVRLYNPATRTMREWLGDTAQEAIAAARRDG